MQWCEAIELDDGCSRVCNDRRARWRQQTVERHCCITAVLDHEGERWVVYEPPIYFAHFLQFTVESKALLLMCHCSPTVSTLQGRFGLAAGTCAVTSGYARSLKQSPACITSSTTVNATTEYPATDPLCLKVGEQNVPRKLVLLLGLCPPRITVCLVGDFSVHCPPDQPCACPTLSYVNVTSVSNNLLGCYSPSQYFCSTVGPQWAPTAASYGHTALIQGSGESNIGVCWNQCEPLALSFPLQHSF